MSQEYIASFNGGELSPLLVPRTDLPIYNNGCATLRNFYVLPQGGVERRQGSEYIGAAIGDESRLITFNFSSDESYIIEISATDINFFDSTGSVVDTIVSPYAADDIPNIKHVQSVDIIYMVCIGKPVQTISRTSTTPTFEIAELEYQYPPFIDENTDLNSYINIFSAQWQPTTDYLTGQLVNVGGTEYSANADFTSGATFSVSNWTEAPLNGASVNVGATITLNSPNEEFNSKLENSYFRLSHQRANETVLLDGTNQTGSDVAYDSVFIGGKTVKVTLSTTRTTDNYTPLAYIQKKTGTGGTWVTSYSFNGPGAAPTQTITGTANEYMRVVVNSSSIYNHGRTYVQTGGSFSIAEDYSKRVVFNSGIDAVSDPLDVSFSDWNINTTGTWTGSLELQKSTDGGGSWNTITTIADTASLAAENITVSSSSKEAVNTLIRLSFVYGSGTLNSTLSNTTFRSEGYVRIVDYIDDANVEAIIVSEPLTNATTNRWSFGAFSESRGFPSAIAFHDSRLVFSGTSQDPSKIYMSYTEDYTNFLTGVRDSDAIQVTPNTNEPCTWLLSRGSSLYQGTRGSVVTITTADGASITPSNIQANESLEFGGSTIQGIKTNETVVYLERLNKKLREVYYSDDEQSLVSRDLTIMSSEIGDGGFTELILQRTPDQIIYGLRGDGKLAGLTYERSQDVFGWAVFDYGGVISSIAIRPSGTHDELWITIERANGRFIERLGSREFSDDLLDSWYVDSGVKTSLSGESSFANIFIGDETDNYDITIIADDHGLSNGDTFKLSGTGNDTFDNSVYTAGSVTTDTFKLKDLSGNLINYLYVKGELPETLQVFGGGDPGLDGEYVKIGEQDGVYKYQSGTNIIEGNTVDGFSLEYAYNATGFNSYDPKAPDNSTWVSDAGFEPAPEVVFMYGYEEEELSGTVIPVDKTWTGLSHLNGQTVQIQGDGGFVGTAIVDSGVVETDYYYNQTVIGLRYFSILRPMYLETSGFNSKNYNKNAKSAEIGFYRTINGYAGNMLQKDDRSPEFDFDELEADWPDLDKSRYSMEPIKFRRHNDPIGAPIIPLTGSKKVNYIDTLSKIKSMFVIADIPMPMTVTSMSIKLSVGGR